MRIACHCMCAATAMCRTRRDRNGGAAALASEKGGGGGGGRRPAAAEPDPGQLIRIEIMARADKAGSRGIGVHGYQKSFIVCLFRHVPLCCTGHLWNTSRLLMEVPPQAMRGGASRKVPFSLHFLSGHTVSTSAKLYLKQHTLMPPSSICAP